MMYLYFNLGLNVLITIAVQENKISVNDITEVYDSLKELFGFIIFNAFLITTRRSLKTLMKKSFLNKLCALDRLDDGILSLGVLLRKYKKQEPSR